MVVAGRRRPPQDGERIVGIVGFADYGPLVPAFDLPQELR